MRITKKVLTFSIFCECIEMIIPSFAVSLRSRLFFYYYKFNWLKKAQYSINLRFN